MGSNSHQESSRISGQVRQALVGDAWYGPPILTILTGVNADLAAGKPLKHAHSIWEIVLHLVATQRVLIRRLDGDRDTLNPPQSEEWPEVAGKTESDWRDLVEQFRANDELLRERIRNFRDDRLDAPLVPGGSSAYNNFHGYIQHNIYHAAQIGLLKKMQSS
ncbi:MAG: DinB family protein [Planctomycetes bacterium]|nr:DinB family protein [Planctomycetota bacterium]